MQRVVILRGISGSGKSTLREERFSESACASTDNFFTHNGAYDYIREKQGEAHGWCLREYLHLLLEEDGDIVVDNTNTRVAEIAPYYAMAEAYGYEVEVLTVVVHPDIAFKRNKHGLTMDMIMSQHERICSEEMPKWWNCSTVEV